MNTLRDPWTYVLAVPVLGGLVACVWVAIVGTRPPAQRWVVVEDPEQLGYVMRPRPR